MMKIITNIIIGIVIGATVGYFAWLGTNIVSIKTTQASILERIKAYENNIEKDQLAQKNTTYKLINHEGRIIALEVKIAK